MKRLLDWAEDVDAVDSEGRTPLHLAIALGQTELAELLLAAAPDIDISDAAGQTPLHIAADKGNMHIGRRLADANADFEAVDARGLTPAHLAARGGHVDFVRMLASYAQEALRFRRTLEERAWAYQAGAGQVELPAGHVGCADHVSELIDEAGRVVVRTDYDPEGRVVKIILNRYFGEELVRTEFYTVALDFYREYKDDVAEERTPEGALIRKLRS